MKALEKENAYVKQQMSETKQKYREIKADFKAYKTRKRAQKKDESTVEPYYPKYKEPPVV